MAYLHYTKRGMQLVCEHYSCDVLVFCDKEHKPFDEAGVYRIKKRGIDKFGNKFIIVVPVRVVDWFVYKRILGFQSMTNFKQERYRLSVRYPEYNYEDYQGILELVAKVGYEEFCNAAFTPLDTSTEKFWVDPRYWPGEKRKPEGLVHICYANGEQEYVNASFVYKARDRLVNTVVNVFGSTADNLYLSFECIEPVEKS